MSDQTSTEVTTTEPAKSGEVLDPQLSEAEVKALETKARGHWQKAESNQRLFMVELRKLQDGGAHLVTGEFTRFGDYAEARFKGLSKANAKKMSEAGAVLLVLAENGLIDLDDDKTQPGTTGLRALHAVRSKYDSDIALLKVYELANQLRSGPVTEADVADAVESLIADGVLPAQLNGSKGTRAEIAAPKPDEDDDEPGDDGADEADRLTRKLGIASAMLSTAADRMSDLVRMSLDGTIDEIKVALRSLTEQLALFERTLPEDEPTPEPDPEPTKPARKPRARKTPAKATA